MASKRAALADAIAAALSGAPSNTFTQTFTISRKYIPAAEITKLSALTLTVVPCGPEQRSFLDRSQTKKQFSVEIGIQKKLSPACNPESPDGNAEIDLLADFAEQIADYFEPTRSSPITLTVNGNNAKWIGSEIDPPYDLEHLRQLRVFTSRIVLTYFYV